MYYSRNNNSLMVVVDMDPEGRSVGPFLKDQCDWEFPNGNEWGCYCYWRREALVFWVAG